MSDHPGHPGPTAQAVKQHAAEIGERLAGVRERLQTVGRDDMKIVAVSKTFPAEAILAAAMVGLDDFGESYAQEFAAKHPEAEELLSRLPVNQSAVRWHFVGGLQRNKVRKVAHLVDVWHSVDRSSLALEIAKHSPGAEVLLQVDISGEETKKGCPPADLDALMTSAVEAGLRVVGLMGLAVRAEPEAARAGFRLLRTLAESYELRELSMGMSGDLEVAAEEGATIIRIGSALFGARP